MKPRTRASFAALLAVAAATLALPLTAAETAAPAASAAATAATVTAEQRARLAEKLRLVGQVLQGVEADLQARGTAENRQWLRNVLYTMSPEQLKALGSPRTFEAAGDAVAKSQKTTVKLVGDASRDLVFIPFAPCRFVDTRNVGGKISGTRAFATDQPGSLYGGDATCNLLSLSGVAASTQIAAYALNLTLVDTSTAAAPGYVILRPAGATQLTSILNWTVSSASFIGANATIVAGDQTAAPNDFEIVTTGPVHAIVDVAGVFAAPTATPLACQYPSVAWSAATNSPIGGLAGGVTAFCPTGYTLTGGGLDYSTGPATGFTLQTSSPAAGNNGWNCRGQNTSGATQTGSCTAVCCRIPGR